MIDDKIPAASAVVSCCRYSDIEGGWPSRKWIQPLGRVSSSPVSGARGSRSASPLASILRTVLWCQSPTEVPCLWEEACESQKSATEALVWPQREPGWHWTSPPSRADRGAAATSLLAAVALRRAASLAAPPRRMAPASTQARYRPRPPWCVCNASGIFLSLIFLFLAITPQSGGRVWPWLAKIRKQLSADAPD